MQCDRQAGGRGGGGGVCIVAFDPPPPQMEHRKGLGTLGTKLIRAGVGWVSTPCSIGAALPMGCGCVGVASSLSYGCEIKFPGTRLAWVVSWNV